VRDEVREGGRARHTHTHEKQHIHRLVCSIAGHIASAKHSRNVAQKLQRSPLPPSRSPRRTFRRRRRMKTRTEKRRRETHIVRVEFALVWILQYRHLTTSG
jgi:hypothetical protein